MINWNEINSVNVKGIDEQHKKLVAIINRLSEMKDKLNPKIVGDILKELNEYANYHFATEEKYFQQFNYPEQASHIKQHESYREKIKEFESQLNADANGALVNINIFLSKWWLSHINDSDVKYSDFFNQHGLY